MKAIVNFRTLPNGSYSWIKKGQRRGYYRVLIVRDENGSKHANSTNVISISMECSAGIFGVTQRSAYYVGGDFIRCQEWADVWNANAAHEARQLATATDDGMPA